jgi:putative ATPase
MIEMGSNFDSGASSRKNGKELRVDARRLLNAVEILENALGDKGKTIDGAFVEDTLAKNLRRFDKGGEQFYDQISALHKSVRGSDPDAALYWLVRMLDGGADPLYIGRRVVRMAVEDIGLADPFALRVTLDAAETFERLGEPEGDLALVQAAVYMARAKKSNALYVAYGAALEDVERTAAEPVPLHLRNASTRLMKEAGYGAGYRYVHDDPAAQQEMTCLPPGLADRRYLPPRRGAQGAS